MDKVVIASMRRSAGKTSAVVGIAAAAHQKMAYVKPLGDRMLYRKKRLWDYDSALIMSLFNLKEDPVEMSIGFDYSKLRYMYDEKGTREKVLEIVGHAGKDKEILFVEGGRDLCSGISVFLDSISLAKYLESKLLIVVSGSEDVILDDLLFLRRHVELSQVNFIGVIINKVANCEEFRNLHLPLIDKMGFQVLGVIPYQSELTQFSISYLADQLFAKVITGERGLKRVVKNILIGAWSADVFMQHPLFKKESKLVITGGDRTDMILAALESDTAGIILTNNILPPSNIIAKASERNIPLLLVFADTYQTAKQIENLEPLLTKEDPEKVDLLKRLVAENVKVKEIISF